MSSPRNGADSMFDAQLGVSRPQLSLRSLLNHFAPRAKANGLIDAAIRRNPLLRRKVANTLYRLRDRPTAEIESLCAKLTERTLRHARRARYGHGRGVYEDWPILTTDRVRGTPADFIDPLALFRTPASTGGTTGAPLLLTRSLESIVAEQFFLDELLAPHGFSMHRSRIAILRGDRVKDVLDTNPPFGHLTHGGRRLSLSSMHLAPHSVTWFYRALREFKPQVLWIYPNAALSLIKLLGDERTRLGIPVILASSEVMAPDLHLALERHFDGDVINYYGQAERVCFAYSTRPHRFFFHPGYGRVDLVPSQPAEPGVCRFRVVATSFWNSAMPLVRYDTGDTILVPADYDEAALDEVRLGRSHFLAIEGREGEYLLTREGVRIIGLNQIPREVRNVFQLQLVQDSFDAVRVSVVAKPAFAAADLQQIERQARAKVPGDMQVSVAVVKQLETNRSGKAPFVLRRIDRDTRQRLQG
jgi:phenylacetate-CoA ligase